MCEQISVYHHFRAVLFSSNPTTSSMTFMTYTPFGRPGMILLGLLLRGDRSKIPVRGAIWGRVRIPPGGRRGPTALANEAGVTEDGPPPAAEVVPRRQARACSGSPAVPWTCPKHRSTAVIHGQQGSVRVPSELWDRSIGSGWRELPKLAVRPYSTSRPANAGT